MNQHELTPRTASREAKRSLFLEREPQGQNRRPLIWLGIATCLTLLFISALVVLVARPAGSTAGSSVRIISDVVEVPSDQKVSETVAGASLVRAATIGHSPYPLVEADEGVLKLPVSTFADRQAHSYTYKHGDKSIEFFVLESSDGIVRSAFNACDVCFRARKGYSHDGNEVICNNCGRRFAVELIGEVQGGCNPAPLNRTVQDGFLLIKTEDLANGLRYF